MSFDLNSFVKYSEFIRKKAKINSAYSIMAELSDVAGLHQVSDTEDRRCAKDMDGQVPRLHGWRGAAASVSGARSKPDPAEGKGRGQVTTCPYMKRLIPEYTVGTGLDLSCFILNRQATDRDVLVSPVAWMRRRGPSRREAAANG